jgi:hypothetical protein
LRKTDNEAVNILTLNLFQKCVIVGIAVIGPLLQTKAKETAQGLHTENFQASNTWLESFLTRHIISFYSSLVKERQRKSGSQNFKMC